MFYFPLFQWNGVPRFLSFLVDSNNYFFGAIFNLADAYISIAVSLSASVSVQISEQVDFFRKNSWRFRKKYYFCTPQFQ